MEPGLRTGFAQDMTFRVQSRSTLNSQPSTRECAACAFTLLELLAVITIIAILSGIVIGVGRHAAATGQTARAKAELAALSAALETYKRSYGDYPQTGDEAQLLQSLMGKRGPKGDEIQGRSLLETARFSLTGDVLLDPWDRPYVYAYKTTTAWKNSSYVLYSVGPDGTGSSALPAEGFPDVALPANADNVHANRN